MARARHPNNPQSDRQIGNEPNASTAAPAPADTLPRDCMTTEEFAYRIAFKPQTLRKHYSQRGEFYGVRPVKLGRRLGWPVREVAALVAGWSVPRLEVGRLMSGTAPRPETAATRPARASSPDDRGNHGPANSSALLARAGGSKEGC